MMNILDFARFYIGKGWQVLPLVPRDKKPLIPWKGGGSLSEDVVGGWFNNWRDANIGIVTGKRSGIVVLDVDPQHNGNETLLALMDKYGALPDTPISRTGSGGMHYIFACPDVDLTNSAGKLGDGLDIRAEGGQICAPPSIHPNGNVYKWDAHFKPSVYPPAPMPKWMIDLLKQNISEPVRYQDGNDYYMAGTRNNALTSLAGTMRRRNMSNESIYAALQTENKQRCNPPLSDIDIKTIVESIARYAPAAPLTNGFSVAVQQPTSAQEGLKQLSGELELPVDFVRTGLGNVDEKLGGLPKGYLVLMAARPGMGKTTLSMQIARNVSASGRKVLFISLEMLSSELWLKAALGIAEIAWKDYATGEVPAGTKQRLQNIIIPELSKNIGEKLLIYDKDQNCTTTDSLRVIVERTQPDLVIIDHLAYLADEAENEIKRLGLICRRLRAMAKEFNFALLLLHHANRTTDDRKNTTKEPRMSDIRGSGEVEQASDIIIMPYIPANYDMSEDKPRVSLTYVPVIKNRIGQAGIHLVFYFDGLGQWFYRKNELPERLIGKDIT